MASNLPDYVASAQPVPQDRRVAWFKSTAQTYAGIMLWFVFWQDIPVGIKGAPGGTLADGLLTAFCGLVLAAVLCHFLYYLVPGLLGVKSGLPLYIVGTSTYGTVGGFLMPAFLMGALQFGWLGVNSYFSARLLCAPWTEGGVEATAGTLPHTLVCIAWAVVGAFIGLNGIKYVARVATFLPLIPFVILIVLFAKTVGGLGEFDAQQLTSFARQSADAQGGKVIPMMSTWAIMNFLLTYIIGYFATAGAAGTDFGMNNRDERDVHLGGLAGITGAAIFAGGLSLLIVAGAAGKGLISNPLDLQTTNLMGNIVDPKTASVFWYLLALASFPPACFSSLIAANSFKTAFPKVNPLISVGIGTLVSIGLAVSGWAGNAAGVFGVIGASFGPICGAMAADFLLSGCKWNGPRAGFNPAGWISWAVGFVVGSADFIANFVPALKDQVPVPPLAAFVVGFVLYAVLAKIGLQSRTLEMPNQAKA